MSRTQQDQFIDDDEDETCPLCVEEFDLTDKGFRPCPCGYQICQFCYHNVKTNMNGLCPACRRPYDDKNIEYKLITPEETAAHKARQAQKQKKTQQTLQKEKQKAEAEHLSRKHLAGLRVVQKNLVYVTGLQPTTQEDQLLQTLRGDQYFGQYGKIIKIVVSKAKDPAHPNSVGVYVTYERKEDAQACIVAVNGSKNGDRTLRAQFGTTKYCSAYLRGETCMNRNCMFLHEPGEANESYSRADLSALNAGSSQHGDARPPPPQSQQPVASASQPMARQPSSDRAQSPAVDGRPALPSHASWASRAPQLQSSRNESRSTSGTVDLEPTDSPAQPESTPSVPPTEPIIAPSKQIRSKKVKPTGPLFNLLRTLKPGDLQFIMDVTLVIQSDADMIRTYPALFDNNATARRRVKLQREEEKRLEQETQAFHDPSAIHQQENPEMSGSLQLGGEPEERPGASRSTNVRASGQEGILDQRFQFGGGVSSPPIDDRGLTQQQQQQALLQAMKSGNEQFGQQNAFPGVQQGTGPPPGHQRNVSRYSFANDSSSASMSVKPVANQKLLNQQASMMPPSGNSFGSQQEQRQFFTSNVQGPPPGLKTTGTPPVSGGMTFGQGHGFATGGLQYGAAASRHNAAHEDHMRNLLRGPGADTAAKHDADFPPLGPPSRQHSISLNEPRHSTPPVPPGFEGQGHESRRSTPSIPPGFSKPSALSHLDDEGQLSRPGSRPSSRASLRRQASQHILPALPLRPSTPGQSSAPAPSSKVDSKDKEDAAAHETPTKASRHVKQAKNMAEKSTPITAESAKAALREVEPTSEQTQSVVPKNENAQPAQSDLSKKESKAEQKAAPSTPVRGEPKKDDKRKHPGKLDITAAVTKTTNEAADVVVATPSKWPKPPSTTATAPSTQMKTAPRTLRVVPTPKAETPPPPPSASSSALPTPATAAAFRMPSRQPSVASIQRPGTPSSEQVSMSDNISITSTSMSRASSPPLMGSKVGTAPVRTKTKNQMKKDRIERAKALEEEKTKTEDVAKVPTEEPAQEAIVSRKKKAKKEKEPKVRPRTSTAGDDTPTPTGSRPATPSGNVAGEEAAAEKETVEPAPTVTPTAAPISLHMPQREPTPPPTPTLDPATLIQELKAATPAIQKCIESLFRTPTNNQFKPSQNISPKDLQNPAFWNPDFKVNLTKDEVDALLKGSMSAIRYGGEDGRNWNRGLVAPSGAHLRALAEELETRFLGLEKAIRDKPDELRFHPSKPQNETRFPHIDLEALKRQFESCAGGGTRGVSVMEQMVQDGSTMKKGAFLVDEASKYINEFVMPPVTPPPSTIANKRCAQHGGEHCPHCHQKQSANHAQDANRHAGLEILERQLQESKKASDEKEVLLRRAIKKNKKILGMS